MPVLRSAAEDRHGGPFLEQPDAELEALPERASAIRSLMQRFESCAHSAAAEVERDGLDSLKRWVTDILPRARARPLPGMLDAAVVVGACEQLHERLADVCMPCSAPLHRLARSASDALGHAASELEQAYVMHSDGEGELDDCADGLPGSDRLLRVSAAASAQTAAEQPVLVIVHSVEEADTDALAAMIRALSHASREVTTSHPHFALLLQLESSAGVLQSMLPSNAASLLEPKTFRLQTSNSKLENLVRHCFLSDEQPLSLSSGSIRSLIGRFESRDPTADGFVRATASIFASHCVSYSFAEHAILAHVEGLDSVSARTKALARRALSVESNEELSEHVRDVKASRRRWRCSLICLHSLLKKLNDGDEMSSPKGKAGVTSHSLNESFKSLLCNIMLCDQKERESFSQYLAARIEKLKEHNARDLANVVASTMPRDSNIYSRANRLASGEEEIAPIQDDWLANEPGQQEPKPMLASSMRSNKQRIAALVQNSCNTRQQDEQAKKRVSASLASIVRQIGAEASATDVPRFACFRIGECVSSMTALMNPATRKCIKRDLDLEDKEPPGAVMVWQKLGASREAITVQDIATSLLVENISQDDSDVTNKQVAEEGVDRWNEGDFQQIAALIAQSAMDLRIMGVASTSKGGKQYDTLSTT